jgi:crotonobetainyl-CoA:carnitine CoA-transferase CaiB-like acyl-CoA transferase
MLEAMAHFAIEPFTAYFALGTVPKSADRPRLAQAHILRTADGLVAIHLSSIEKFWTNLLTALEAPELATDARFATRLLRIDNYDALGRELDARFSKRSVAEWVARMSEHDVPFAPLNKVDAVVNDPQVQHLGLMVPIENPHAAKQQVRPPVQFDGARADSVRAAPLLNEQGANIRAALATGVAWPELV